MIRLGVRGALPLSPLSGLPLVLEANVSDISNDIFQTVRHNNLIYPNTLLVIELQNQILYVLLNSHTYRWSVFTKFEATNARGSYPPPLHVLLPACSPTLPTKWNFELKIFERELKVPNFKLIVFKFELKCRDFLELKAVIFEFNKREERQGREGDMI